ncbi:MAG TPA: tetratricopeptide repeat protein, partial [Rudaea sp.]
ALARDLPEDSPARTEAALNLGWIEYDAGRADRAEPLLREALARQRHALGEQHPVVADALAILASAELRLGRCDESKRLLRAALAIDAAVYSHPHPHTAWHLNDLANTFALAGRLDEAAATYARSIAMDEALAPASALNEAVSIGNLARLHHSQGNDASAEAGLRDAIARKRALLGSDYADNGRSRDLSSLGEILIARRNFSEAQRIIDEALNDARDRHPSAHPDIGFASMASAELLAATNAPADAASRASEAVSIFDALADTTSENAIRSHLVLGEILLGLHRNDEAQAQFSIALASAQVGSPRSILLARARNDLMRIVRAHRA